MTWPMVKLKELVIAHYGKALKKETRDENGDVLVYGSSGDVGFHCESLTTHQTIVIGRKGSVGKVIWAPNGGWIIDTAYFLAIKDNIKLDWRYLFYVLQSLNLDAKAITTSIPGLNRDDFYDTEIPLPPLAEQKRIAAILDKADAIRQKRQQAIALADQFLRSVFLDMFGDPVTNPKGWDVRLFGDISNSQLGKMLSQKSKGGNSPKKYLRNANIRWRHFDLNDLLEMDFNPNELLKFKLEKGDLLVCEGGEIGRCAIWNEQINDCYYQKALHRVRPNLELVTSIYLQEYLYSMSLKNAFSETISEVTFSHLTSEKIKLLRVPVPPLELQKKFNDIYDKTLLIKESKYQRQFESQYLYEALAQKAFSGQL